MNNERGNITKAPETGPRTCFSEQGSPGPHAVTPRFRLPHRASDVTAGRSVTSAQSRPPRFITRPSSLQQFGNCCRILSRGRKRLAPRNHRVLGDPALRSFTGNSFGSLPAAGLSGDVTRPSTSRPPGTPAGPEELARGRVGKIAFGEIASKFGGGQGATKDAIGRNNDLRSNAGLWQICREIAIMDFANPPLNDPPCFDFQSRHVTVVANRFWRIANHFDEGGAKCTGPRWRRRCDDPAAAQSRDTQRQMFLAIAKRSCSADHSENPPSTVATGRVLGPAQSSRDPCSEISP